MGSSRNPDWMEEEDVPDTDCLSPVRPTMGLEASELDLLRSAPDYDAEEMSTVRPPGGWPSVAEPPAAACKPAAPAVPTAPVSPPPNQVEPAAWAPPNRIEPPARAATGAPAAPTGIRAPGGPSQGRQRFPEERTVALMAEDLLGRPLDEPGCEAVDDPLSAA